MMLMNGMMVDMEMKYDGVKKMALMIIMVVIIDDIKFK